ncbi:flagellar biosynthetic protein FliR [Bacillota bacterium LX-D]|nr:flagellar biosynthetic protein FliR [Bacillota bacterium LX-D]
MIDISFWLIVLLIFARMTAFVASAPFFSIRSVPPAAKGALGLLLAVMMFPVVAKPSLSAGIDTFPYLLMLIGEVLIGLALGFTATVVFNGFRMAGQLIDLQIGLSMVGIFDPQSGSQNTILAHFMDLLAILLFTVLNGHYIILAALAKSYELLPLGFGLPKGTIAEQIINIFCGTFSLAVKIAAPVLAVLIIIDFVLGLVARTVPQLNVFILGFPLKIGFGIVTLSILLPFLVMIFTKILSTMEQDLLLIIRSFG